MKGLKWIAMFGLLAVVLVAVTDDAMAQRRGGSSAPPPPRGSTQFTPFIEISGHYGQMWGGNVDLSYSGWGQTRKLRMGTGSSYGIQLDYNLHPMQAVEFSYTRQDGKVDYDYQGITTLFDTSVNFWHLGSVRYLMPPGGMRPFILTSIGATYFSPQQSTFELEGETYYTQTSTKLSFTLGLGLKAYFGEAEKFGLRATFKTLPSLYNTGGGVWFGSGGGGLTVSGNAIWQWEAAIGLTLKLG
jgi:hypothetical protein